MGWERSEQPTNSSKDTKPKKADASAQATVTIPATPTHKRPHKGYNEADLAISDDEAEHLLSGDDNEDGHRKFVYHNNISCRVEDLDEQQKECLKAVAQILQQEQNSAQLGAASEPDILDRAALDCLRQIGEIISAESTTAK